MIKFKKEEEKSTINLTFQQTQRETFFFNLKKILALDRRCSLKTCQNQAIKDNKLNTICFNTITEYKQTYRAL